MDFAELHKLSNAEKLRIITQLWDEIAASPEPLVIPPDVLDESSRQIEEAKRDPSILIDDEELWRRVDGASS